MMKLEAEIRPKVIAVGASGPVGRTSLQVATCARAQKLEPRERQFNDKRGRPAGICLAGALPADLFGYERMVALAAEALREAGVDLDAPAPMVVALPEPGRPDDDARFGIDFIRAIAEKSGVAVDVDRSAAVRAGHAGMALALEAALGVLRSGPTTVIVGGVDSYFHPEVIAWLDAACRLHALEAENGFIPSEGAAFLVLSRAPAAGPDAPKPGPGKSAPLAVLLKVATGREETVVNGEPNIAAVMTDIVASLVDARGGQPLGWVLTDLNGERHRHLEWEKVSFRGSLADPVVHDRLVQDIGDVGAATGAMYAAMVCTWWRIGRAPGQSAAIALHSEGPERGAFLLETIAQGEDEAPRPEALPPTGDSPARDQAAASRDAVERVLLGLKELPGRVKREPIVAAVEETMAALSQLETSDIDDGNHLDLLDRAIAKLVALKDLLAESAEIASLQIAKATKSLQGEEKALRRCRDRTIDVIVARQDRLLRGAPQEKVSLAHRAFRASIGVPTLHTLEEPRIAPVVKVAPPPGDYSGEESASPRGPIDAERVPAQIEGEEEPRVVPERPFLERLAHTCMEEIAIMGRLRDCVGDERFLPESVGRFEQRLLDNLDALVALSPRGGAPGVDVTSQLLRYVADAPTLDGDRPFARALVLGSIDGDDAIRAGILALRQSHLITRASQREALHLAPSPAIGPAMRRLCVDSEPALTILALDVLRLRREGTFAAVLPSVTHPEIGVRLSAARCLGFVPERAAAVEILARVLDTEEDERVAAAAAQSLLLHGARRGLSFARERLTLEIEEAGSIAPEPRLTLLRLLCLAGAEADGEIVLRSLTYRPEEAEALGWFGHPGHIEPLLDALERRDLMGTTALSRFETEISRALHRITGASPGVSSEDTAADLDLDDGVASPARWRAWWEEHRGAFAGSQQKHRFGRPFSPLSTIEELAQRDVPMRTREVGEIELGILTSGASRFDAHDWVARQNAELAAARALFTPARDTNKDAAAVDDRSYPPGEWPAMRLWRGESAA